jgi:hypothetical protein
LSTPPYSRINLWPFSTMSEAISPRSLRVYSAYDEIENRTSLP